MPSPKSGTAGSLIEPIAPIEVIEADVADPGEVSEAKARDHQSQSGKYGSAKTKAFKPPEASEAEADESQAEEKTTTWIEIELVGEDDKPIPGEKYRITLPDQSIAEGTLDHQGWARVAGFEAGQCTITFPDLDKDAWEFIESVGAKSEEAA